MIIIIEQSGAIFAAVSRSGALDIFTQLMSLEKAFIRHSQLTFCNTLFELHCKLQSEFIIKFIYQNLRVRSRISQSPESDIKKCLILEIYIQSKLKAR